MSEDVVAASPRAFIGHARVIGAITFVSRLLGMARESVAANYFGAGAVWSAFTVAFTIPNLFRKLFGEGALSAAFIPLYAQAVKRENSTANDFAAASVNLLAGMLVALTIAGELILWGLTFLHLRSDYLLAVKLTAVMLPYVLLVCGTAFLGAILQVHHRFTATAATSIVLNLCLIIAIVAAAKLFDLRTETGRVAGAWWLAAAVLVAGIVQILMLLPSLRAVGFRFTASLHLWTPAVRKMLVMTIPVALSAGVLQVSVLLDKGISFLLAQGDGQSHFHLMGMSIRYPLAEGAAARLNWAQFMYQFPLGVFAIALATAIFPRLSADALDLDRKKFKEVLRRGVEASLFIGLPASVGMIIVRYPAVRLLFEHGSFNSTDTKWVALSTAIYSAAIWAFSLQQILNRAYYALHDTWTPLIWGVVNLSMNLVIELPLLWSGLGESAMAVGTLVSFSVQAVLMLWLLNRRLGGIGWGRGIWDIAKMVIACCVMWLACEIASRMPGFPENDGKLALAGQLAILMSVGGGSYFATCWAMGVATPTDWWKEKTENPEG